MYIDNLSKKLAYLFRNCQDAENSAEVRLLLSSYDDEGLNTSKPKSLNGHSFELNIDFVGFENIGTGNSQLSLVTKGNDGPVRQGYMIKDYQEISFDGRSITRDEILKIADDPEKYNDAINKYIQKLEKKRLQRRIPTK